ncbi:ribonuclease P protein component [Paenibacillus polysaccharolyticus]|uniref:Ribonuclease P protein component n=2 Tax=Paenibacillus TaxID=44249 RepID=A0A1G5KLX8_9BACL|nr:MULTISPECIES: ribonuclease P protein component [Paenibacillus]MDP9700475.1 ribonuclease P protein component [Paenibacillus intestini]MBY0202833.1 ribonuclease P protein component [Paenibacillus cucumis (ex Kampfer et al. 2016)]MCM3134487.1 ribonuclease P protein component [Paenibacillus polysaccharolyticus]MCP1136847.1 ribonuclease P protein component [Paenibacillus polysaccharolyticus]SCZ01060.1 ribonuclease P protein component [Paenibacillus polysaccharolyticus]
MYKRLRLRNRADFSRVYRFGKSFANHQFVVYGCRRKDTEQFRVGVSCSKKIGNAVVRNRMRRMIKEIVRHHEQEIVTQMDLIFIVRKGALGMPYKEMEKSLLHVLRKASLLKSCKR